jgi:hypothetical protein
MSRKPSWARVEPSTVIEPARFAEVSVLVVFVVQLPETVVERVVVVVMSPTTVSLADTVDVVEPEHWRLWAAHVCIEKSVAGNVTE